MVFLITKIDKLRWENYKNKKQSIVLYGLQNGLIKPIEDELIENGRKIYYGGMPISVYLVSPQLSNGYCYDRSLFISLAMPEDADYDMVDVDIDGITLNPIYASNYRELKKTGNGNKHYGNHCVVERRMNDGTTWVYDPSVCHAFRKDLYVAIENPKETVRNSKEKVEAYIEYEEIKNSDINRDKYILPLVIPIIDDIAFSTSGEEGIKLRTELELHKKAIGYDQILSELHTDMQSKGYLKSL